MLSPTALDINLSGAGLYVRRVHELLHLSGQGPQMALEESGESMTQF